MSSAARSSATDVDAWTRSFAQEQAGRAGLPLREWLIRFVAEQTAQPDTATPPSHEAARVEPAEADARPADERASASAPEADQSIAAAPIEPAIEAAPGVGPDLEALVVALRAIAGQMQAANVWVPGQERPRTKSLDGAWAPAQGAADAMARLGADLGRLIEVVDCGYERIEAIGALRDAELRAEIAQLSGTGPSGDAAEPPVALDAERAGFEAELDEATPPFAPFAPVAPATFGRATARFLDEHDEDLPAARSDGDIPHLEDRDPDADWPAAASPEASLGALEPQHDEWLFADPDAAATTSEPPPAEPPGPARGSLFPWLGRRQGGLRRSA